MSILVYYSTKSGNTRRFVERVGLPARRIPISSLEPMLMVEEDYILIVPTYGGGRVEGAIPPPVKRFLNVPENRARLRGVIAGGNTCFGEAYCLAAKIIAQKCQVPHLYNFELLGTPEDVEKVRKGVTEFWIQS